ncbi:hypothetical protein CSIRO_3738 [Bradyrhizobiaceae bacterium SG-6C]|nr:hypothetical protein CSIRO_3738 [Bradyrhizobiaceae bacterium SG-6C]
MDAKRNDVFKDSNLEWSSLAVRQDVDHRGKPGDDIVIGEGPR